MRADLPGKFLRASTYPAGTPAAAVTDGAIRIHLIGVDTLRSRDVLPLTPESLKLSTIFRSAFRVMKAA